MPKAGDRWTDAENALVLSSTVREAHRLLPHRTHRTIAAHAYKLRNLAAMTEGDRNGEPWSAAERRALDTYYPILKNKALREKHLPGRAIINIIGQARRRGLKKKFLHVASVPIEYRGNSELVNQIRMRAKQDGMTWKALDRELGSGEYFRSNWHRQRINLVVVARAIEFFGGKLIIDWCDR